MKSCMKQTSRDVVSILDSDDELPDAYEETSQVPAYLNDSRFDHIELPWLNNCKPVRISQPIQLKTPQEKQAPEKPMTKLVEEPNVLNEKDQSRILLSEGVLTTQDLFFVKSIEEYCSESTMIWFIESLKNKCVLPDRFRKSCLTKDFCYANYCIDDELDMNDGFNDNYYLNLIVL